MACKLRCPKCKRMLKEAGDEGKVARGEYLVIYTNKEKTEWLVECMACGYRGTGMSYEDM